MYPFKLVVIDLETTGNSPKKGEKIIQLSAVIIEGGKIIDQFTSFVSPGKPIPAFIEELTGINDDMVKNAPAFHEIAPKILELLDHGIFVAHNVQFDLSFLQAELEEAGYNPFTGPAFDTVELAKVALPSADSFKLTELSNSLKLSHVRPHQADSDAYVTAEILLYFIEKLSHLPLVTLEKLYKLSRHLKSDLDLLFDSIVTEKQRHVEDLSEELEVYRGIALRKKNHSSSDDPEESTHFYEPDFEEHLANEVPFYEKREQQLEMMNEISDAFRGSHHVVIEAGTGVGKSLGYLWPAVMFSKRAHEKVVISTFTIQLQEQLLHKEIKLLEKICPVPFKTVLLKGKNHYINLFKFEQALREDESQYDVVLTKMQILVWLTRTESGDMDELNLTSGGQLFWNRLKHDGWHLTETKDPWIGKDFYLSARKKAQEADIIITNHSMLLTDMVRESSMLPAYDYLVIDEAHHLEKSARQHLGVVMDYLSIKFSTSQLGTLDQKQLFYRLDQLLSSHSVDSTIHPFELDAKITQFYMDLEEAISVLTSVFYKKAKKRTGIQKIQLRITEEMKKSSYWQPIIMSMERVISGMNIVEREFQQILDTIKEKKIKLLDKEKALIEEFYSFLVDWTELKANFQTVFLKEMNNHVLWLDGDTRSLPNSLSIQAQPITVDRNLQDEIFAKKKSVVLTSATLTVSGSFNYFLNEIGLIDQGVKKLQLSSPFDYHEVSRLFVPTDVPEIQQVHNEEYIEAISSHLIGVAQATKGRMLILFTSYDMLRKTYELMKESGLLEEYVLMAQGITSGSRTRLTKNFQRFDKAILFGTSSFWEGVDIPGEDLSCLAMVRLPFSPPDEPVNQAKSDILKAEGKNPFSSHSLPEAIIRFKQGVGRLIRRSSDRGVVIVYDRRIMTTRYGKAFLQSIPSMEVKEGDLYDLVSWIEDWL
ncbi:ATP-dependent DNA helicase DinG [Rossellomorea aquimaris]|uniref:ATP-dependent DNA helicase DinG n=1 Tax=Rossellomorea aquimaris TaxID=189382 RepID=UPI001CD2588E|nr:ATP-dependent DNA helicase DinG [Rossellomorea aquimaris]MCA1058358.1 ATP-dependent DNA helicase DinG [Rossellomorea aquimaris]